LALTDGDQHAVGEPRKTVGSVSAGMKTETAGLTDRGGQFAVPGPPAIGPSTIGSWSWSTIPMGEGR
jgi:hypothetical protein